jgi:TRAP-type C4-dicarboxylate transport system permease small subunit
LTAATGILFANVVFRYLLAEPFAWAEELTALMQMWFVFLPQAWIEARNEHLFLTVLTSRITHAGTNRILQLARSIGIILVNSYLVYYGTKVVLQGYRFGSKTYTLEFPFWIVYAVLPVSLALVVLVRVLDPFCTRSKLHVD